MNDHQENDSYPYSSHSSLDGNRVNYMRNSVKVGIDAYNGTTTFYVFDTDDPIIAASLRSRVSSAQAAGSAKPPVRP